MILFPPCKINLGLHVIDKRPDGFHNLDTLMYQLPMTDLLEIIPAQRFSFTSSGLEIPGDAASNLCIKAFELMKSRYGIPDIQMHLHKIIPMGGGLGGGSSNATYVLLAINRLFDLDLSTKTLQQLAAELGSDCPLFVENKPQIAQGRGEILQDFPLDLSNLYVKLVNLGIHVSTKEAFSKVDFYEHEASISEIVSQPIETWKYHLKNDFETSVFQYHPALVEVKEQLYDEGAVYASMSGSGSTLFGIYRQEPGLNFEDAVFEKVLSCH